MMERTIGIIGGMGPKATTDLYNKIIENTMAHSDYEHPHVIIDSNTKIPDRTSFILKGGESPSKALVRSALKLEYMGADFIIIPCNTAHYFVSEIEKYADIPVINIIKATASYARKEKYKKVLLLATEGTYSTGIYKSAFEREHIELIYPTDAEKKLINKAIYQVKGGEEPDITCVSDIIMAYNAQIDAVILGCTELPVLFKGLKTDMVTIDPTLVLAKAAIEYSRN